VSEYEPIVFVDQANPLAGNPDDPQVNASTLAHIQSQYAEVLDDVENGTGPIGTALNAAFVPKPAPRLLIWDDDWYTDVDQVIAARLLGYYSRIGKVNLLASIVDTTDPRSLAAAEATLRHEGLVAPIGQIPTAASDLSSGGNYLSALANYPHADVSVPVSSTTVYREALASAEDGSVDIATTGYLGALKALLESAADGISALTGAQLVAAKVRHLWLMGGNWPSGSENNFNRSTNAKAAAKYVIENWPTTVPLTLLGYEVGETVVAGSVLTDVPPSDPVRMALTLHGDYPTGRSSWDAMTVMLAVSGDLDESGYTSVRGTAAVASDGSNSFTTSPTGPHEYVVKARTDAEYVAEIDALLIPGRQQHFDANLPALPAPMLSPLPGFSGTVLEWWSANGMSGSDGASIASVLGALGGLDLHQPVSAWQPVLKTSVTDGFSATRRCLRFSSTQWMKTQGNVIIPGDGDVTIYAIVRWDTLPSANRTVVSLDRGVWSLPGQTAPRGIRSIHLGSDASGKAHAADFNTPAALGVGWVGADAVAGTLTANKWQLLTVRRDRTGIQVLLDGVAGAKVTTVTAYSTQPTALILGAATALGNTGVQSEAAACDIAEVRIYAGWHTDAQVATIKSGWI